MEECKVHWIDLDWIHNRAPDERNLIYGDFPPKNETIWARAHTCTIQYYTFAFDFRPVVLKSKELKIVAKIKRERKWKANGKLGKGNNKLKTFFNGSWMKIECTIHNIRTIVQNTAFLYPVLLVFYLSLSICALMMVYKNTLC